MTDTVIDGSAGTLPVPPSGAQAERTGQPNATAAPPPADSGTNSGSVALTDMSSPADRVNIQPLDLAAALQILVAEIRADLSLPGASPSSLQTPMQAARTLVQLFLQTQPDVVAPDAADAAPPVEAAAGSVLQLETEFMSGLDRAVATVAGWRNVPSEVVDGAAETRSIVLRQFIDDPPNPAWLRPEWLGLAPLMRAHWRRRRLRPRFVDGAKWRSDSPMPGDDESPMADTQRRSNT